MTDEQREYLLQHGWTEEAIKQLEADYASMAGHKMKGNFDMNDYILPIFQSEAQRKAEAAKRKNRKSADLGWRLPIFEEQPAPVSDGVKAIWKEVERQLKNKNRGRSDYPLAQHVRSEMDKLIKELK